MTYSIQKYSQWVRNTSSPQPALSAAEVERSGEVSFSFIGGGLLNTISAGATYASIFNGKNNVVSGDFSSIFGGSGNNIGAAYQYAGIFGCNVNAVASCALHANNFVAQNMPTVPGAAGSGCFYSVFYAPLGGTVVMVS